MILAIVVLFVAVVILGAVVGELRATVIQLETDLRELTTAHNDSIRVLEKSAEKMQVVEVVGL